jgi:hypothetical protein
LPGKMMMIRIAGVVGGVRMAQKLLFGVSIGAVNTFVLTQSVRKCWDDQIVAGTDGWTAGRTT